MSIMIKNLDMPIGCQKCKFFRKHMFGNGLDYSYSCILGAKEFPMPWIRQMEERASDCPIKPLEQEPCEDVAKERYEDLCEYFGGAKDILKHREDFKAWLGRVKWHIHKAEELYEKYEYKKEPCENAISRQGVIDAMIKRFDGENAHDEFWNCDMVMGVLRDMPSVKPICEEREKGECPYYAG